MEPSWGFDRGIRERVEELASRQPWYFRWFAPRQPSFAVGLAGVLLAAATVLYQPSAVNPSLEFASISGEDQAYLEEFNRALDDIEMRSEFEIDPAALAEPDPS